MRRRAAGGGRWGRVVGLLDSGEPFLPEPVQFDGGADVAEAVFGDVAEAAFGDQVADVVAGDAGGFGGGDAEGFAVEVEVELAGGAVAAADVVEGQLFGEVTVGFGLEAVAEPVFAGDGDAEHGGAQVEEGDVEAAAIEGDDVVVAFGEFPEVMEQLRFLGEGDELHFPFVVGFVVVGEEQHLATAAVGVDHGDTEDLGGKGVETELPGEFGLSGVAFRALGQARGVAQEVLALGFVEGLERETVGFDVEHECGHGSVGRLGWAEPGGVVWRPVAGLLAGRPGPVESKIHGLDPASKAAQPDAMWGLSIHRAAPGRRRHGGWGRWFSWFGAVVVGVIVINARTSRSEEVEAMERILREVARLEAAGQFVSAERMLSGKLTELESGRETERRRLEFERERLGWIRRDFRLGRAELFERVGAMVSRLSPEEFDRWIEEGRFDRRTIDGEERFFGSSVANLFFRYPELETRRIPPKRTGALPEAYWRNAEAIRGAAVEEGVPYVLPKRFRVRMHLEVAREAVKAEERVTAWLPVPRRYPFQYGFDLSRTMGRVLALAGEESPIRSVQLEQVADGVRGPRFEIEYEYTSQGVWFDLEAGRWQRPEPDAVGLAAFLGESPHVRFTPAMRQCAERVGAGETNGVRLARRYYEWIAGRFRYSYAPEYATIRDLAERCRVEERGDCGQVALLFMTLCRLSGIPARWQSGWAIFPGDETIHDWCEIHLAPWGWVPVDAYMGMYAMQYATALTPRQREQLRDFYFGGLTQYRMAANRDHCQELWPAKRSIRADPVDFQRGEAEVGGRNLDFGKFDYGLTWEEVEPTPGR